MAPAPVVQDQVAWATCNVVVGGEPRQFTRGELVPPAASEAEAAERAALRLGGAIRVVEVVYTEEEQAAAKAAAPQPAPQPAPPPAPEPAVTVTQAPPSEPARTTQARTQPTPPRRPQAPPPGKK